MKIRQDNRGLSLIELIIAIAVSTIILGAVTMFLYSAQKSYKLASETIDLQIEAQLLMEQVGNWVMESDKAIVKSDAAVIGDILVLYDIPANNGRPESEWKPADYTAEDSSATKWIIWSKNGKLFMKKITGIADAATDIDNPFIFDFEAESAVEDNVIGELVQEFKASCSDGTAPKAVSIEFIMKKGSLTYDLQNKFKIRNGM